MRGDRYCTPPLTLWGLTLDKHAEQAVFLHGSQNKHEHVHTQPQAKGRMPENKQQAWGGLACLAQFGLGDEAAAEALAHLKLQVCFCEAVRWQYTLCVLRGGQAAGWLL